MFGFRSHAVRSVSLVKNCLYSNNLYPQSTISLKITLKHEFSNHFNLAVSSRMINASSTTGSSSPKWKLLSAICLERTPIISPPMTKIEQEMSQMFEKLDRIKSLKSEHELRQDEDKYVLNKTLYWLLFDQKFKLTRKLAKNVADGNQDENNPDAATRQTAQDFEDACNEELNKFIPSPRITGSHLNLNYDFSSCTKYHF